MFILFLIAFSSIISLGLHSYILHIYKSKKENLPYDYVSFNTFIREFDRYRYSIGLEGRECSSSMFLKFDNNYVLYLHGYVVKINGKCMIFYPIDWFIYCMWIRLFNKPKSNRVKGLWR